MGKKSVDMIASGYEWICPVCDYKNKEIEIEIAVTCFHCHGSFEPDASHAYH